MDRLKYLLFLQIGVIQAVLKIPLPSGISDGDVCAIDVSYNEVMKLECGQDFWYGTLQENTSETKLSHLNSEEQKFEYIQFWDDGISFKSGGKLIMKSELHQLSLDLPQNKNRI